MKKLKIWSGISLALLGAGSLAVIPSMLTGCSKGAHVVVDYDSVNALKQKDLSIATTADAAFKEWQ
ncbi:MAG: hypothetical protein LBG49_02360, partial [Mycoplasmataceae bacterium]|nr:hypothetical protein [Mycoplasmataceae bacterium]